MFRVKGSTIIEAMVAMTITLTVFGATLSLLMNIGRDMNQPLKVRAEVLVRNEITGLRKNGIFQPGKYSQGNIEIERLIYKNDPEEELNTISIIARRKDSGKLILKRRLLILDNEIFIENVANE